MEKYTRIGEPDQRGRALFRRERDGKTAVVKAAWFKPDPRDADLLVPRSKSKDLHIANQDWE